MSDTNEPSTWVREHVLPHDEYVKRTDTHAEAEARRAALTALRAEVEGLPETGEYVGIISGRIVPQIDRAAVLAAIDRAIVEAKP